MKIHLTTLGCPKNVVDSEVLLGGLTGDGIEIVENPSHAETIILNTCGFIQGAKEESIETILQATELKKTGSCKRVFVTGCLSQRYKSDLVREIPEVDGFYGNRDMLHVLKDLLTKLDLKRELIGERRLSTPNHYAYLKISEGCKNPCTFCSIPEIRGSFRSRTMDSVIEEAQMLAEKGVKELIIIAQDSTIYGQDLNGKKLLVPLLEKLTQINKFKWVRLLYTYPYHFSEDLIEILSEKSSIINYVDIPIQHISNRILKQMARKVSRNEIVKIIEQLRMNAPDLAIRSTVLVGFPGETEEDHQELAGFLEEMRFDRLGLFAYSREENTPAYHFPNQVEEYVKQERLAELNDIQNQVSFELNQSLIGTNQEVIIDNDNSESGAFVGRTSRDCPEIDNIVEIEEQVDVGNFYKVKITDCTDYDLMGRVVT